MSTPSSHNPKQIRQGSGHRQVTCPRHPLFWTYVLVAATYLTWRVGFTLSADHSLFSFVFFVAELFSIATSVVFYAFVTVRPSDASPPRAEDGVAVDIFIATYDESTELVRTTVVAARNVTYPHRTWICDDGKRKEMRALAEELGVEYITRPSNTHFKAGNLNHALSQTAGELVVVLDADHVLAPEFLSELLGYFHDPELALVQIPQIYYNLDSYQHVLSDRRLLLWHEAAIFHHRIQPGAGEYGAAFFVGTGAILRRSSLEAIGGFATGSVTEDIHTSLRLHAAGYRSVYVDRPLGYMLAPDTPLAYACQRLRWTQGAMQVLRGEPALWSKSLKPWQRVGYLNSLLGYFAAYQHLVFYLAPGIFLLTGLSPISVDPDIGLPVFATYIVFSLVLYKLVAAPYARLFLGECYKMLNLAIHIRGSLTLLSSAEVPFRITPKGAHEGLPLFLLVPAVVLFLFNLTAVGVGVTRIATGSAQLGSLLLATGFAIFFAVAGALASLQACERRSHNEAFVFPVSLRSTLRNLGSRSSIPVQILRLNHSVAYLALDLPASAADVGRLDLHVAGVPRPVHVEWMGQQATGDLGRRIHVLKIRLIGLSASERDAIDRYLFETSMPQFLERFRHAPSQKSITPSDSFALEATRRTPEGLRFLPVRSGLV